MLGLRFVLLKKSATEVGQLSIYFSMLFKHSAAFSRVMRWQDKGLLKQTEKNPLGYKRLPRAVLPLYDFVNKKAMHMTNMLGSREFPVE